MNRNDFYAPSPLLVAELRMHLTKEALDFLLPVMEQAPSGTDPMALGALISKYEHGKGVIIVSQRFANVFVNLRSLFTSAISSAVGAVDSRDLLVSVLMGLVAIQQLVDGTKVELSSRHGSVIRWLWIDRKDDFGIPIGDVRNAFPDLGDELPLVLEDLNDLKAIELDDKLLWKIDYLIIK
jgi:hypothetical protein